MKEIYRDAAVVYSYMSDDFCEARAPEHTLAWHEVYGNGSKDRAALIAFPESLVPGPPTKASQQAVLEDASGKATKVPVQDNRSASFEPSE